jgi:hypothetical protein
MKDHRRIDERSRAFGQAVAELLTDRPGQILDHPRANIDRWLTTCTARARRWNGAPPWTDRWQACWTCSPPPMIAPGASASLRRSPACFPSSSVWRSFGSSMTRQNLEHIIRAAAAATAAGRENDLAFVEAMVRRKLISTDIVRQRLAGTSALSDDLRRLALARLERWS